MTDLQQVIYNIKEAHKQRQDLIRAITQLTLRVEANYRRYTAIWASQNDIPESICKPIGMRKDERHSFEKALEKGNTKGLDDSAIGAYYFALDLANLHSEPYRRAIDGTTITLPDGTQRKIPGLMYDKDLLGKKMETLAKELPVYEWALACRGLGTLSVAQIIGETGDLSNYATISRVWKRLGLAVIKGQRQRKTTDQDLAIEMGYDPERRAIMWIVGDNLIRGSNPVYKPFYDTEKVRLAEAWPEASPIHRHRAAHRHMEKEFLLDLWREWNQITGGDTQAPSEPLAAAASNL